MKKVSLIRCDNYELDQIKQALDASIEHLGGLDRYIKKGDRVLLKVNLLMKKTPEEATTTHPVFVEALAKILIDHGAEVLIGDSPGGPFNERALRSIYKATGMETAAQNAGAALNYNTDSIQLDNPQGLLLKKLTATAMLQDVNKVISVSKLKTHGMMTFTGAVKNMFGIIPGIIKAEYHMNIPSQADFASALMDICLCANPVLSFMDAIVGMEGEGPSGGEPVKIGAVIASDSPYHLDKAACSIICLDFNKVPTIVESANRKLCSMGLEDIAFSGDPLESFVKKGFRIPQVKESPNFMPPGFLGKAFSSLFKSRPVFHPETCISCGICRDNCPAKVIHMENKKPEVHLKGCIRCFCCQELCPEKAVSIHRPAINNFLTRL